MNDEVLMNTSYKLSEPDVVAMQLNGRGSKSTLIILLLIGTALVLLGLFTGHEVIYFGAVISGIVVYFAVLLLLVPFTAKKQFKQNPTLRNEISMELSELGVNFKSDSAESNLQWNEILKWKFAHGIYLLYITKNVFYIVPSRALSDETALVSVLSKHVGPVKA
jgi:hypothetical protein